MTRSEFVAVWGEALWDERVAPLQRSRDAHLRRNANIIAHAQEDSEV